jgi:hypothetical protein
MRIREFFLENKETWSSKAPHALDWTIGRPSKKAARSLGLGTR